MKPAYEGLIGNSVASIDTPALVIDLDAMERNLQRMADFASQRGVKIRPHAKMHKSAALALQQIRAGAVGICVQKTAEAEAMAAGGVRDIYISNEVVGSQKLLRVAALAHQLRLCGGRLAIAVDSLEGIERLATACQNAAPQQFAGTDDFVIDVFIELDVGHGRCGVSEPAGVVHLAREIQRYPALRFAGLQAYHGRAQHLRTVEERKRTLHSVIERIKTTTALLSAAGLEAGLITGAGTGTFGLEAGSGVYGELQAGSYLFMDVDYTRNQVDPDQPQFEHALFVKSQVMSVSAKHAVCDAGHKSHAIDSGLPLVHGAALQYTGCSDEHGTLVPTAAYLPVPALGDVIWLIPGHCDPTVNLHDFMIGVRGGLDQGIVEQIIPVDSRGALT